MSQKQTLPVSSDNIKKTLLNRKVCKTDALLQVNKIRKQYAEDFEKARQDSSYQRGLPDISTLPDASISYSQSVQLLEYLKKTEDTSTGLLGSYKVPVLNKWDTILSSFLKNNLYLMDVAEEIEDLTKDKLPSLKKVVAKFDLAEKELEAQKSQIESVREKNQQHLNGLYEKWNAKGKDLLAEVIGVIENELPGILRQYQKDIASYAEPARLHYSSWKKFSSEASTSEPCLESLETIARKGLITAFELQTGSPPTGSAPATQNELKKYVDSLASGYDDNLDFGEDDGLGLDLDDSTVPTAELMLNVLEHPDSRHVILGELNELSTFLRARLADVVSHDNLDVKIINDDPNTVMSKEDLQNLSTNVDRLKTSIGDSYVRTLIDLKTNEEAATKFVDSFIQSKELPSRLSESLSTFKEQAAIINEGRSAALKTYSSYQKHLEELKNIVEEELSKHLKNPVAIVGPINQLLSSGL